MRSKYYLFIFVATFLFTKHVLSQELFFNSGSLNHSSLSGCCQNGGSKSSYGVLVRLNLKYLDDTEISAYSNGSFSTGQIAKVYYLLGQPNRTNQNLPQISDAQITTKYVSSWKWIISPGLGYFSHTTRTKNFDLPALVSGTSFSLTNHFVYSLTRAWSLSLSPQMIYTYSPSDQSFWFGGHLGLGYEF